MTNNNSIYHELAGQYVVVNTRSNTFIGFMESDTHESIHLRPSVVSEPVLIQRGEDMKNIPHYRLERERPSIFATLDVSAIQPTTEEHVRDVVNYDAKTPDSKVKLEGEKK